MLNQKAVISFFDRLAPHWDADMIRSDEIIGLILDNAGVTAGKHVLDVACGTGVLFPDYLSRDVASLTAIDISPEMAKIAQSKYPESQVKVFCGDVETAVFDRNFDCIVVYNAFPHFPEPVRLIKRLASLLNPGGTLTVAHGMSRAAIDNHHKGAASEVSQGLIHEDALAAIFRQHMTLTTKVSNDRMYQLVGQK